MAAVSANGITIEYDLRGDGEPLLLVMGLGGQLTDWPEELLDRLVDAGFQVIRFDNRDSGLSTGFDWEPPTVRALVTAVVTRRRPPAGYLLSDMARDAAELLTALGHESAHVVGMSMGGMIAQTLAISHPSRVRTLTSIMSNTGDRRHGRPRRALAAKFARMPEPRRDTAVDDAVTMFGLISGPTFDPVECRRLAEVSVARSWRPKGTARQAAAIFASPDRTAALGLVRAPTLVLHGLVDPLVMPSGGMATARAIPGSRLIMYPEMGHDLPRLRLAEIVAEIARHAERAR